MQHRKQTSFSQVLLDLRDNDVERRNCVKIIDCSYTQASDDDLSQLVAELSDKPHSVEALFLAGNQITDKSVIPLSKFLTTSKTIHTVDLSDNQVGKAGADAILEAITWNDSICNVFLGGNDSVENQVCDAIRNLLLPRTEKQRKLKAIDDVIQSLKSHQDTDAIDLGGNGLVGLACVKRLLTALDESQCTVKKLNLGYNRINDEAGALVCAYAEQAALHELHLDGNSLTDAVVPALVTLLASSGAEALTIVDIGDNSLSDVGVNQLYDALKACKYPVKMYVGGNSDLSGAVAKRFTSLIRTRSDDAHRIWLDKEKHRAVAGLETNRLKKLQTIFTSHEKDDAGVVRVARLPQMMQQLGAAAKSEQLQTILKRLDRPSFETGLVDFATFVLILERWHDEFDPSVVVRKLWQSRAGERKKVGVDVIQDVLMDMHKPIPNAKVMERIICQISPNDMQLDEQQFNHLLTCWEYLLQNTKKICKA